MQATSSVLVGDMPLNETDKAWIRQQIQDSPKRRGFGKLTGFIKDWNGLGAAGAIFIFLLIQWGGYIEFRTHTGDRLDAIEQDVQIINTNLQKLTSEVETLRLKQLSGNPSDSQSGTEIKKLLDNAKANKVDIDASVIKEAGSRFIKAAQSSHDAWNTALAFLNYRSFLNAQQAPPVHGAKPTSVDLALTIKMLPGFAPGSLSFLVSNDAVPLSEAARIEPIGGFRSHVRPEEQFAPSYIIMKSSTKGLAVKLDGMLLKNVIIQNVTVVYQNGPLILHHVHFVNCIFAVKRGNQGEQLAKALLASHVTNFPTS